jgi:hypothetical protein
MELNKGRQIMWKTIVLTAVIGAAAALGAPSSAEARVGVWVGPNGGVAVRASRGYRPYYGGYAYSYGYPAYGYTSAAPCCVNSYPAYGYAYSYPAYGYRSPRYYGGYYPRGVVVGPNGGAVYGPRGVVRWR